MNLNKLFSRIPSEDRIPTLEAMALSFSKEDHLKVNFICTHNSRRSHFCEILFRTAAHYYGIKNIQTFSGGTESTSLYPEVAESFARHGFKVLPIRAYNQHALKFSSKISKGKIQLQFYFRRNTIPNTTLKTIIMLSWCAIAQMKLVL